MFTLLAEQQKKYLTRQYRLRLLSVALFLISGVSLVSAGLILPSRIMLGVDRSALTEEKIVQGKTTTAEDGKNLQDTLKEIKAMIDTASPEETKVFEAIQVVLAAKPIGVNITSITYTRGVGAPSSITIGGVAQERANLLNLTKSLGDEELWSDVSLPVSNLAKESNLSFTIGLVGKF